MPRYEWAITYHEGTGRHARVYPSPSDLRPALMMIALGETRDLPPMCYCKTQVEIRCDGAPVYRVRLDVERPDDPKFSFNNVDIQRHLISLMINDGANPDLERLHVAGQEADRARASERRLAFRQRRAAAQTGPPRRPVAPPPGGGGSPVYAVRG